MGRVETHTDLWLDSGCLSRQGMLLYVSGRLPEEQLQQLEKHLEACSLCREAMEGFRLHPQALGQSGQLYPALDRRIRKGPKAAGRRRLWVISSAAAVILLLFSVFTADFLRKEKTPLSGSSMKRSLTPEIEYMANPAKDISPLAAAPGKGMDVREQPKEALPSPEISARAKSAAPKSLSPAPPVSRKGVVAKGKSLMAETPAPMKQALVQTEKSKVAGRETVDTVFYSKPVFLRHGKVNSLLSSKEASLSKVFVLVTDLPVYTDSLGRDFQTFLEENAHIPIYTSYAGEPETVYLDFGISRMGELQDIRLIQGSDAMLNMEAIRLVSLSEKWQPAQYHGRKVDSRYFVPVRFRAGNQASSTRHTGQ